MLTKRQLRQSHGDDVPLHILEQDYIEGYQVTKKEWERDLKVLIDRLPDLTDVQKNLKTLLS